MSSGRAVHLCLLLGFSPLAQLKENAVRCFGMNKRYPGPARTIARHLVDQLDALGFQLCQSRLDVVDSNCDMMQALAALLDKLGNRAVRAGRFQQLDLCFANGKKRRPDFLFGNIFNPVQLNAQRALPECERLL